jgi:ABC-type Mn2+/Zn2+ transport system permease subunit
MARTITGTVMGIIRMAEAGFIEALRDTPLLQRGFAAGALAGVCCAALSPLVVLRRMAFVGDGLAHASFGGMGLALFVLTGARFDDLSVQALTILFCVAIGIAVARVSRRGNTEALAEDSAIGIAFSVSMALGAVLIALRQRAQPQYVPPIDTYLFGSLLNIGPNDVLMLVFLTAGVLALLFGLKKEVQFYAFDAGLAEVSGLPAGLIHYLFMILLVLVVVVSSRVVGIVLVSASLILPGVAALKLCRRLQPALIVAALIGVATFETGLYLSYVMNVHPGSMVVLVQFAVLCVAFAIHWARKEREVAI